MAKTSPRNTTLKYIKNVIADFFWGLKKNKKKHPRAIIRYPSDEGGIGIR